MRGWPAHSILASRSRDGTSVDGAFSRDAVGRHPSTIRRRWRDREVAGHDRRLEDSRHLSRTRPTRARSTVRTHLVRRIRLAPCGTETERPTITSGNGAPAAGSDTTAGVLYIVDELPPAASPLDYRRTQSVTKGAVGRHAASGRSRAAPHLLRRDEKPAGDQVDIETKDRDELVLLLRSLLPGLGSRGGAGRRCAPTARGVE